MNIITYFNLTKFDCSKKVDRCLAFGGWKCIVKFVELKWQVCSIRALMNHRSLYDIVMESHKGLRY